MKCPACKSEQYRPLDDFNVSHSCVEKILPQEYKIFICSNCNLYFKNYVLDQETLAKYYNSLSEDSWEYRQVYPHEIYLGKILENMPDAATVLDVGCSTGRLLEKHTSRLNCFGVELNSVAAAKADKRGIKIIADIVKDQNIGTDKYDMITLIDVFEHLADPIPYINMLIKALKKGGTLYVFTGTTNCFPAQICRSYYWYYRVSAQHLIFLNPKFIRWFKSQNHLVKVDYFRFRHFPFHIKVCMYQILWHIAWRFFSPSSPYRWIALKNLERLKEPFMITSWKDHVFMVMNKK